MDMFRGMTVAHDTLEDVAEDHKRAVTTAIVRAMSDSATNGYPLLIGSVEELKTGAMVVELLYGGYIAYTRSPHDMGPITQRAIRGYRVTVEEIRPIRPA